ncbi:MAG: GNAT family N-acetyltransferase, partial [Bacteroidetes bacterium]
METMTDFKVELRNLRIKDFPDLTEAMTEAYSGMGEDAWTEKEIENLLSIFPEGQICVMINGKVVACAFSLIVNYTKYGDNHTYKQITGNSMFTTHDPEGDVLYGIDLFVHPDFRGMRLARRLYDARKELCENLNLRAIVAGGRIPIYRDYADELTPKQYIEKVKFKEIYDPILTFQLSNGFHVKKVLTNYLENDTQSKSYATLIEWNNVYYEEHENLINAKKSVIRLGLVQWQMRNFSKLETLIEQIEFFVDVVSDYQSDFILFPELFNAPLMAKYNHQAVPQAIRSLAKFTEPLRKKFLEFAVTYNVNIITGSMPILENGNLYNISYLCRRDGSWDFYNKIHVTPNEAESWGMMGGSKLGVFDTDCGRIGILICYDVEFPELSRLYAEEGVEILFVPFLT